MNAFSDGFAVLLLDVTVKAALLAAAVGAGLWAMRVRNGNVQHRAWMAVLVGMLLMPLLVLVTPSVPLPGWLYPNWQLRTATEVPTNSLAASSIRLSSATIAKEAERSDSALQARPQDSGDTAIAADANNRPDPSHADQVTQQSVNRLPFTRAHDWAVAVLVVYSAGALFFVTRLLFALLRARTLIRYAQPILLAADHSQWVGKTTVCASPAVHVPATVGWWRPCILLPRDWSSWSESLLVAVLSHEQAHVRRRDQWVALLAELNRALYWFHPVAWFLRRRLAWLAETACDDAVIESLGDRAGYARHLLEMASRIGNHRLRVQPAGVAMARVPRVEHRINAILDVGRPLTRRLNWSGAMAILAVAVPLMLVTAGLKAENHQPPAIKEVEGSTTSPIIQPERRADIYKSTAAIDDAPANVASFAAGPVREIAADETGDRVFEFPVNVPRGRRFRVTLLETPTRVYAPTSFVCEKETDVRSIAARLNLLYPSNSPATRRDDILLSDEKELQISLTADGCYPSGVTTFTGVPLNNMPATERKLILIPPESPLAQAKSGVRLLLIVGKEHDPQTAADVEKIEPRGELIVSLEPTAQPKPSPTPQQQLASIWRQSEGGIGTLFIRYQHFFGGQSTFKPIEASAVREIVLNAAADSLDHSFGSSETDSQQGYNFISHVSRDMLSDDWLNQLGQQQIKLGQNEFRMVGPKTFSAFATASEPNPYRISLFDGDIDISYSVRNNQVDVYKAGDSRISPEMLRDFLTPMPLAETANAAVEKRADGRVILSAEHYEVVADPTTGFVERFTRKDKEGNVIYELFQFGPKAFPGRVTFPVTRLEFQYLGGRLLSSKMILIDELRLNEGFRNGDFAIKLPTGTNIFDYRHNTFRPDFHRVEHDIEDVSLYLKELAKRDDEKKETRDLAKASSGKSP